MTGMYLDVWDKTEKEGEMYLEKSQKTNAYPELYGKYKGKVGLGKGQVQTIFTSDC